MARSETTWISALTGPVSTRHPRGHQDYQIEFCKMMKASYRHLSVLSCKPSPLPVSVSLLRYLGRVVGFVREVASLLARFVRRGIEQVDYPSQPRLTRPVNLHQDYPVGYRTSQLNATKMHGSTVVMQGGSACDVIKRYTKLIVSETEIQRGSLA